MTVIHRSIPDPRFDINELLRRTEPPIDSVAELEQAIAAIPEDGTWWEKSQDAMGLFHRADPWPGTAAELRRVLEQTLDAFGVPDRARSHTRLMLSPAELRRT